MGTLLPFSVPTAHTKYDMTPKETPAGVFVVSYNYTDSTGAAHTVDEDIVAFSSRGAAHIIQQYLSECNYPQYKVTDAKLKEKIFLVG